MLRACSADKENLAIVLYCGFPHGVKKIETLTPDFEPRLTLKVADLMHELICVPQKDGSTYVRGGRARRGGRESETGLSFAWLTPVYGG